RRRRGVSHRDPRLPHLPHRGGRLRAAGAGPGAAAGRALRAARARMKLALPPWVRPRAVIGLLAACAVLAIGPLLHSDGYTHNLLRLTFLGIAAALAWNWLGGYLGQVSFGHAAMFGVGGFVSAQCEIKLGVPMVPAWISGGVLAGSFALIWGHPTLRLRGPY